MPDTMKLQKLVCELVTDDAEDGLKCGAHGYIVETGEPHYTEFVVLPEGDILAELNDALDAESDGNALSTTV